jgi:hypothetical protein
LVLDDFDDLGDFADLADLVFIYLINPKFKLVVSISVTVSVLVFDKVLIISSTILSDVIYIS